MDWQKLLLAAGGAAGVAAILYYLLKDDPEGEKMLMEETLKMRTKGGELSKEEVLDVLKEISGMQQVMKENMKKLTKEMAGQDLGFDQIYERVKDAQPTDPLEKRGLSAEDLDRVLQSNGNDPEVMHAVSKIMGPPEQDGAVSITARAKEITVDLIVDIHVFMLEELKKFVREFADIQDRAKYDLKTVGIVSQAVLDSKVGQKYSLASEDMEGSIMLNKDKLMKDMKFMQTHMEMQQVMQGFLGAAM
uniref:Uncharacterized protein n=1 Tax=Alexandrium catenella TaxID=2925 RepID=A0A7S1WW32_ALECA|mmetsp:Transcript_93891/g.249273  ORF Transcript_93891/g.249273 Transcript_93891/m.249273 type:complete len:247 (+) Transcript_93891:84-824(+)